MFVNAKKRIAVIDYDSCNPLKCGNWFCESVCPVNRSGKECIIHEGENQPTISEDLCIGCGLCLFPKGCPFDAISIINLQIDPGPPIHQFGQNLFRLHGLPQVASQKVTGIVGRNGTGKTTALKILSGEMTPNLGDYAKPGDWKDVQSFFRGREIGEYFSKVSAQKVRVSIKPQAVDMLPKAVRGNVRELLAKADERRKLNGVIRELNLENVMERQIHQLSGGELQKVALAASYLKGADLWFVDEPSSFLDIRERLRAATFIKGHTDANTASLVVEHDFILLDYLSDQVFICTGKPAVYGLFSHAKNSREGLNEYLAGYLKEENLRFRDHGIQFYQHAFRDAKKTKKSAQWPDLEKKLGDFSLKVGAGTTFKGEVIGILGANGIGKTTFMKMLTGEIKADNTDIDLRVSVAYKPQYLEKWRTKQTVALAFAEVRKIPSEDELAANIWRPLEIQPLLEKTMDSLSGGELQRVAIGLALAQTGDLVLLDEPSAFLDIEQRLASAKAIRDVADKREATVLVIDHDLSYIDAISDRLIVFTGEPAVHGQSKGVLPMEDGFNTLLHEMGVTLRRDKGEFRRPRINKPGSVLDREQKSENRYYFG